MLTTCTCLVPTALPPQERLHQLQDDQKDAKCITREPGNLPLLPVTLPYSETMPRTSGRLAVCHFLGGKVRPGIQTRGLRAHRVCARADRVSQVPDCGFGKQGLLPPAQVDLGSRNLLKYKGRQGRAGRGRRVKRERRRPLGLCPPGPPHHRQNGFQVPEQSMASRPPLLPGDTPHTHYGH